MQRIYSLGICSRSQAAFKFFRLFAVILCAASVATAQAQEPVERGASIGSAGDSLARQLAAGEYSLALSGSAGSGNSADRLGHRDSPGNYSQVLAHRRKADRYGLGSGSGNGQPENFGGAGFAGGMVQADFDSLIELIQTVVEPDSWEENGGTGSITSFQNGVLIDVAGQLRFAGPMKQKSNTFLGGESRALNLVKNADLRFISLPKLEAQLNALAIQGQPIPESLQYLGGMYEIQAVVVDPAAGDLFLVGPAGPWETNEQGVAVHVATRRPVLHLDDLVACLRNVMQGRGVLGCSIDPRPGQFQKAADLAAKWNLTVPQVRARFLTAVGPQDTVVFGVPNGSHAAHVLLTADYHIKLLAMGTVNGGPQLPSFLDRCKADDPPSEIIRWWFTLAQPTINQSEDGSLYTIQGPVMELKTEAKFVAGRAAPGQAAPPRSLAAESFVADFNRQLPQTRRLFPVYGQLENLFHLAVIAQLIHGQKLPSQVGWQPSFLVGHRDGHSAYAMQRYPEIREVELVVNHRTLQINRIAGGGQAQRQVIMAISGGVEVNATWDKVEASMKARAVDAFPSALRTGAEDVRATLRPVEIGIGQSKATLPNSIWFADNPNPIARKK
ncbi:MAG: DUF1598 domain-containing protein [Pirellulaceae bacterium]|nr:DUF1598 domain-containing protein [Pirellulaceae bacterium]